MVDLLVSFVHGVGTLTWTTTHEVDLQGFNVVVFDNKGTRIQQNRSLITCLECVTGLPVTYRFPLSGHKGSRSLFVEMVRQDGSIEKFGPAIKP